MAMSLEEFVKNFICPNTLIRLWVPVDGGHEMLVKDDKSVCMNHALIEGSVWQSRYNSRKVIGVTDILVDDFYKEAVNIVINPNVKVLDIE